MFLTTLLLACSANKSQGTNWWETGASTTDPAPEQTGPGDDAFDDEEEDGEIVAEKTFWGGLEAGMTEGGAGFYWADESGERCEMFYPFETIASVSCDGCSFAYRLVRGTGERWAGSEEDCAAQGWTGLEGTVLLLGHGSETLYQDTGSGFVAVGESWIEDDQSWFFEILLEGGDTEDGDTEEDEGADED